MSGVGLHTLRHSFVITPAVAVRGTAKSAIRRLVPHEYLPLPRHVRQGRDQALLPRCCLWPYVPYLPHTPKPVATRAFSGSSGDNLRHAHARGRRATAYGLGATRALLRRGHRGRVRPRLHRRRALCRSAALSSNGLVRTCAVATPVATRQQRDRLGFCPKRPLTCCFPSG
jgi:hypothetical protein